MFNDKKSIAWCVLTYNNSDVIYDVWESNILKYKDMGIDVYFFDSSSNILTQDIIERYIKNGLDNVYYIRLNSSLTYDEKLMYVMSEFKFEHDYQYIWPAKDRTFITCELYSKVMQIIKNRYSILFLGVFDYGDNKKLYDEEYTDVLQFYCDWGYLVTSLDVCVYNADIIHNIDWNKFRYSVNWNENYAFTQYALVFYILTVSENKVYSLDKQSLNSFYNSTKGKSQWNDKLIDIWVKNGMRLIDGCLMNLFHIRKML